MGVMGAMGIMGLMGFIPHSNSYSSHISHYSHYSHNSQPYTKSRRGWRIGRTGCILLHEFSGRLLAAKPEPFPAEMGSKTVKTVI